MENVCRTCLRIIGSTYSISYLNKTGKKNGAVSIREKLESCVPELTLDIVVEPAICSTCTSALNMYYQFKSTCIQTEKTLYTCIKSRQKLNPNCTDLISVKDLLKIARKDINSEHNYSYVERFSPSEATASESDSEYNYDAEKSTATLSTNVQTSLNAIVQDSDDVESPVKTKPKAAAKRASIREVNQNGSTSRENAREVKRKEQGTPSTVARDLKLSNAKETTNQSKNLKQIESPVKETKQKNIASKESSHQFKQQMKELQERQKVTVEKVAYTRKAVSEVKQQQTKENQSKAKILNSPKEVKGVVQPQERRKTVSSVKEVSDKQKSAASKVSLPEVQQPKEVKSTNVVRESSPKKQKIAVSSEIKQQSARETQKVSNAAKETGGDTQKATNISASKESKSAVDHKQSTPLEKQSCDKPLKALDNVKNSPAKPKKVDVSKENIESPKSSGTLKSKTKNVPQVVLNEDDSSSFQIPEVECAVTTVKASPKTNMSRSKRSLTKCSSPRKITAKLSPRKTLPKGKTPQKSIQNVTRQGSEVKASSSKSTNRRGLTKPIEKSLDKIIQKLKEHADHDCGPIVNIENVTPKKTPKILPLADISSSKEKSQEDAIKATVAGEVRSEIGSKKRKAYNIERRQIGIKRSCRENRKPSVVKFDEEVTEEEVEEEEREEEDVKPIKDIIEDDEDLGDRVTKLVDEDGIVTYQCNKCLKIYRYMSHFEVHERAHILTKLFSCPICNKTFSHEKHVKAHQMIHKNLGPYKCRLCSKRLSSTTALRRHLVTHTGEKAFACSVCEKAFAQKIQLAVHMRIHTGQKPFSCDICEATFTQKSHLMGHVKIHTGEKPYKCDLCWKQFRKPYALNLHKECHQRKPFQCKSCDFLVKDVDAFKRHIHKHLLGRLPLKNKTNKPKQIIINELKEDFKNVNKLKKEIKSE